jgi:hypothetical protein
MDLSKLGADGSWEDAAGVNLGLVVGAERFLNELGLGALQFIFLAKSDEEADVLILADEGTFTMTIEEVDAGVDALGFEQHGSGRLVEKLAEDVALNLLAIGGGAGDLVITLLLDEGDSFAEVAEEAIGLTNGDGGLRLQ